MFVYKIIAPHYRNLDYVSHKTEHRLTLEIVYQSKSETEIDLKKKSLEQDEELRGNTSRPEKNILTNMDHLTIPVNHTGLKFFFLMDFLLTPTV